jgi:hypothetical protein
LNLRNDISATRHAGSRLELTVGIAAFQHRHP